jgi:DNA-binding response OmpR family regulator/predicted regulator of Ras-like GTPase activity (Roadblock/LC7/MglB family)
MSDVWRIFVVESDENLNQSIVNSLRKDGYDVQGVLSGADAVRVLWSEEYDVVISDIKAPGAEGIELLQWLRAYRPNTHVILIGGMAGESGDARMQALEGGAASYLEKPLDLHLLKEELRRLLQQTGFSANLDSFDLLDVIQIITLSRKSIALLVNTGLEERGILRFKNGELIWAEYGLLRGEEAFFALAAHKNGTVIHQPWHEQAASNVTQPLSRLILQALQYRTKYAQQQFTGEQEIIASAPLFTEEQLNNSPLFADEIDDRPFTFVEERGGASLHSAAQGWGMPANEQNINASSNSSSQNGNEADKEWWEKTGGIPEIKRSAPAITHQLNENDAPLPGSRRTSSNLDSSMLPATLQQSSTEHKVELPSWLTGQPTSTSIPAMPPSKAVPGNFAGIPIMPLSPASATDWSVSEEMLRGNFPPTFNKEASESLSELANTRPIRRASAVWPSTETDQSSPIQNGPQAFVSPTRPLDGTNDALTFPNNGQVSQPMQAINQSTQATDRQVSQPVQDANAQRTTQRTYNYASLIAALQSLGYAISGFEAAAIANVDGQPIAQVSIDDQDLSQVCKQHSVLLRQALQMQDGQDLFEDLIVQSRRKRVLLRMVGNERNTFLLLITLREADLDTSREVVANIENAISVALHG